MDDSRTRHQFHLRKQYFELRIHQILSRLPLTKALVVVVLITLVLFLLTHWFGFLELHSKVVLISHERHHNVRVEWEANGDEAAHNPSNNVPPSVSVQLHGRTGNMMFAYASLLGLAEQFARTAVFPEEHYFRMLFRITAAPLRKERIKTWVRYAEKHSCIYDSRLGNFGDSSADMIELLGYFQSWKYFDNVKDELRKQFTFRGDVAAQASNRIEIAIEKTFGNRVRRRDVLLIGIHVRRGDIALYDSFLLGYTTASREYVSSAMAYFTDRYNASRLLFVLCSDDFEWCEENVKETKTPIFRMLRASDSIHLAILASCNHTIMTVGSFGWWGAFLAGGETVYYKDFPRPASPLATDFLARDYFYPGWIGM